MTRTKAHIVNKVEMEFRTDDMLQSGAYVLVNPVNCVGVMGKGLAVQFKKKFPAMHRKYKDYCDLGFLQPGGVFEYKVIIENPYMVICSNVVMNVATKDHWRDPSNILWVEAAIKKIASSCGGWYYYYYERYKKHNPQAPEAMHVAVPALGCGEGGLPYANVLEIMEREFWRLNKNIKFLLYPPK